MTGTGVEKAEQKGGRVVLTTRRNGGAGPPIHSDHVIAATGYRVNLNRLRLLYRGITVRIRTVGSIPVLSSNFESSLEGLYFVGVAAAGSFGPLMRFMHGAEFAAGRISRHFAATR